MEDGEEDWEFEHSEKTLYSQFYKACDSGDLESVNAAYQNAIVCGADYSDEQFPLQFPKYLFVDVCMQGNVQIARWMTETWKIDPMDIWAETDHFYYDVETDWAFQRAHDSPDNYGGQAWFKALSADQQAFLEAQWPILWWMFGLNTPEEFWTTAPQKSMTDAEKTRATNMGLRHDVIRIYQRYLRPVRERFMTEVAPELIAARAKK